MPTAACIAPSSPRKVTFLWDREANTSGHGEHRRRAVTLSADLRLQMFDRVWVDADGWIVSHQRPCSVLINGGCYKHIWKPWTAPSSKSQHFRNVVTLATHWGEGHYHFVAESLVGLAAFWVLSQQKRKGPCVWTSAAVVV